MEELKNKFLITIDTEPDCDIHWKRSKPLTFISVIKGIPNLLRPIWDEYGIKPIYFVSPEVVMNKQCCQVLKNEVGKGAIIGAHLHSEYIEPNITIHNPEGKSSLEYPCYAHNKKVEYEKIRNLTKLIEKNIGVKPIWYRAARYGADLDTIKSLSKLGYMYDSSVTPHINWEKQGGPDHSKAPEQPYWISKNNYYASSNQNESAGVKEIPLTISKRRFGIMNLFLPDNWLFYNWLRPSHMTIFEQKRLVKRFIRQYNEPTFCMMFHSMEIIPKKTPFVRNQFMQEIFLRKIKVMIKFTQIQMKKNYEVYQTRTSEDYQKKTLVSMLVDKENKRKIIPKIKYLKNKRILELGCGTGKYTSWFYKNNTVTCVDVNPHLFKLKNVNLIKGNAINIDKLLPAQKFENICSFFMTEYLNRSELRILLKAINNRLTNKGEGIITFISKGFLGCMYINGSKIIKKTIKYNYSKKEIKKLFDESGLKITAITSINKAGLSFANIVEFRKNV